MRHRWHRRRLPDQSHGESLRAAAHEGAGTDGGFKAEIFSYARAAGLFAGVSFQGSSVQPDRDAIRAIYGPSADARAVLLGGKFAAPPAAREFLAALQRAAPPRRP